MSLRILLVDSNHEVLHQILQAQGFDCDCFWHKSTAELRALLPQYDGLVIRSRFPVDAGLIEECQRLKVIGRVGAGMENIDLAYARRKGIACVSAPEGNRDAVGEHALGMLLMLLNKLKIADEEVRKGIWRRAENRGTEIHGKTIGIIGYGQMGSAFAEKLRGFGCRILAHDKYRKEFGQGSIEECTLETLKAQADVISIHLPLNEETRGYLDADFFNACKRGVYIINTARGACLRTSDLVNALKEGQVAGACLDVMEYESSSFENIDPGALPEPFRYLVQSDRVVLSPHIAGWTQESNYKMSRMVAEKMIRAFNELSAKG